MDTSIRGALADRPYPKYESSRKKSASAVQFNNHTDNLVGGCFYCYLNNELNIVNHVNHDHRNIFYQDKQVNRISG